ncbi:glycosyltransferase family 2 protein [Bacillus sp. FJAT-42376]|uniref:glycosyltransferase family 2 protein n=1 Tax=Bacillus sp. FJAT-42376 TaxID=2014076 RepID=UPI000F51618E|nr:glycosyltransferase family 2 protein [Bacillus sp. FJAT-42376]AZB41854.1 glycosyltransferase family 2 protein [Bacillus sp. FJAT-42376]
MPDVGIVMPDVGIVMPVYYQNPAFLTAAIQSILAQTYANFKFVIVIDGAPEMKVIAESLTSYDPRVTILDNGVNKGVTYSLNRGFDVLFSDSEIRYFTWVSSDNVYYAPFIETLRNLIESSPEPIGLVHSSFRMFNDEGQFLQTEEDMVHFRRYLNQPKENLLNACTIGICFLYKKDIAAKIAGYGSEPVEDYEYWLRLTEHCDIKYVPVELASYRVNSKHSISAKLQTTEQHRRWRYAFHFVRHQARQRRNIPLELTLLLPLNYADESTIARLENVYEQTYSNYLVVILDLSPDQHVTNRLTSVSHPLTTAVGCANQTVGGAIQSYLPEVTTPYVMVLNQQPFSQHSFLQTLITNFNLYANHSIVSFGYSVNETEVIPNYELPPQLHFNELYSTNMARK